MMTHASAPSSPLVRPGKLLAAFSERSPGLTLVDAHLAVTILARAFRALHTSSYSMVKVHVEYCGG
jgi:hypothetical protein